MVCVAPFVELINTLLLSYLFRILILFYLYYGGGGEGGGYVCIIMKVIVGVMKGE